jgi:hypothetical protein
MRSCRTCPTAACVARDGLFLVCGPPRGREPIAPTCCTQHPARAVALPARLWLQPELPIESLLEKVTEIMTSGIESGIVVVDVIPKGAT